MKKFWLSLIIISLIGVSVFFFVVTRPVHISPIVKSALKPAAAKPTAAIDSVNTPSVNYGSEVNHGPRDVHEVALTFDADMTPYMLEELHTGKVKSWYNQKIVEILEKNQVPATIFMAGMWSELYPDIAKSLAQNPLFEIANHSYSHPRFTPACFALPPVPIWGKEAEFSKSQAAISKATGVTPQFFRFPGGCHTPADTKIANKYGLTVVGWDVASGDSFNTNRAAIINTVEKQTQNGSIILFHFHGNKNAPLTADVLPEVLDFLKKNNYKIVKLSQLLAEK